MDYSTSSDTFSIRFDGSKHEIDAELLGRTALNITFIVNEIAKQYPEASTPSLKIRSLKQGSFIIDFELFVEYLSAIMTKENIALATSCISAIKGLFEIKKMLRGNKPQKIKTLDNGLIEVTAPDGSYVRAPAGSRIIFNPQIDRKVTEIGQSLSLHDPERGMELISNDGVLALDSTDVHNIAIPQQFTENAPSERDSHQRVSLPIQTIVLLGNAAWKFKYGKRSISAPIKDETFLNSLRTQGQPYMSGDKLDVNLITHVKYSPTGEIISETYTIDRVYGVIPRIPSPQQTSLF